MELIKLKDKLNTNEKIVATIGEFDGIHVAHQKLIFKTKEIALKKGYKSAVITFYPHPDYVLKIRENEGYLNTIAEKIEIFEKYGIDYLYLIDFNEDVLKTDMDTFFQNYLSSLSHIVVGYDFRFGYKGLGDASYLLQKFANNIDVIEEVKYQENKKVSSNDIRAYLKEGNVEKANSLLGYLYSFEEKVSHGARIGITLGYPTANIVIDKDKFIPRLGVYFAKAIIDSKKYYAVCNIGLNPSINSQKEPRIEVHIIGFNETIYEEKIKIMLCHFLRDEKLFASKEELACQIKKDKEECLKYFKGEKDEN